MKRPSCQRLSFRVFPVLVLIIDLASAAFALQEYALALLKGNTLDPAAKEAVVRKIARYTGLSPEFIDNANQFLRVFVANGYYDGATPFFATEYTFFQTDLGGDLKGRVKMGYYEAGHMMYIHKSSHAKLKADLAEFIRDASGVK